MHFSGFIYCSYIKFYLKKDSSAKKCLENTALWETLLIC